MWRSLVSARGWGPRGRGFESLHLDTDCWPNAPGLTSKATAEGETVGKFRGIGVPSPSGEPDRGVHPHSEAQASTTGSSSEEERRVWDAEAGISRLPFPTSSAAQCLGSSMAERQPSKLAAGVRFPLGARQSATTNVIPGNWGSHHRVLMLTGWGN